MTEPNITQADRDAAIDLSSGPFLNLHAAKVLARHREAAEQATVDAIVAWLRGSTVPDHSDEGGCPFDKAARAIQSGEWRKK